jgi:hypothetical protein
MHARLLFTAAAGLLLALSGSSSAEVSDLADFAPARSLAYVELHDTSTLARELHALIKGSYLQHPSWLLANHTRKGRRIINEEAFLLAWFGSPEFIDELGDWQGGFLALTGLTKNDEPEMVGILRTGKSRMLPLALRMILLESGPVHCIARVEGMPIFQIGDAEKRPQPEIAKRFRKPAVQLARLLRSPRKPSLYQVALLDDAPVEEIEEKSEFGCFLSLLPGAIAFGTTADALSDAIRRFKRVSATPSLATVPAFRAAAEMRSRPGLFAWCDPPPLTRIINDVLNRDLARRQDEIRRRPLAKGEKRDAAKLREELRQAETEHRRETGDWTFLQKASNLAGMHYAAAGCSLHKGEFAFRIDAHMNAKQTSPLLDLLANVKLSTELLRAVPSDAFSLFAVPLPEGAATLASFLRLADAYVADSGEGTPLLTKSLAELEKRLRLNLGRDVLAKIRSASVAVHLVEEKEPSVYPVIILEAVSDIGAADLEALVPRLYAAGGKHREPHQHMIAGQRVRSMTDKAADASLTGPPPHYGRRGKILVLGWHRGGVAATLAGSSRQKDLLCLQTGAPAVDAEGPVGVLGLFSCRQLLAHLAHIGSTAANQGAGHRRHLRYLREISTPMAAMRPTIFSMKRLADGMRIEFRQSELPVASATVVDMALTWMLDNEAAPSWMNFLFAQQVQVPPANAAPVPPPPAAPAPAPAPAAPVPVKK